MEDEENDFSEEIEIERQEAERIEEERRKKEEEEKKKEEEEKKRKEMKKESTQILNNYRCYNIALITLI